MGQLARAVRLSWENNKFHWNSFVELQGTEIGPALRQRNVGVGRAMENQNGSLYRVEFKERRFLDVQLRIFKRRLPEIVRVKRIAEIHIAPITDPFNIARANAGHFVARGIGHE